MLRRSVVTYVTAWDFGQPHMASGFGRVFVNKPDSKHIVDAGVERSKLDNGVTVVTHDMGGAAATVGFYADAGAKYDPALAPGLSHLARHALWLGNMSNSLFQIDRTFRNLGMAYGNADANNKRHIGAWATGNRAQFRDIVDQLAPAFAAPRFAESDLERWRDNLDAQREETRWQNPRQFAVDELERVAFYKEPLGNPRMVPPECNDRCNHARLIEKYAAQMGPERVTVVGINVNHQDLVAAYEGQSMPHSATAPHHANAAQVLIDASNEMKQYYPGKTKLEFENRSAAMGTKPDQEAEGVIALGWLTNGGADETTMKYAAGLVYRELLAMNVGELTSGVNGPVSTGPQTFNRAYSTAGLVGLTLRGAPASLPGDLKTALQAAPTDFAGPLSAAKSRAAIRFYEENVERSVDYATFLASSKWSAEEVLAAIDGSSSVGVAELADVARKAAPCYYATGDVMHLPTMRQLGF